MWPTPPANNPLQPAFSSGSSFFARWSRTKASAKRECLVTKCKGPREGERKEEKRLACFIPPAFLYAQICIKRVTSGNKAAFTAISVTLSGSLCGEALQQYGSFINKKTKISHEADFLSTFLSDVPEANISSFNMPWCYQICIAKCLNS